MPQLIHDDTFRRLCRGRDLLASEYQSRVLLEHAAREACLSEYHFHRLFRASFGETPHEFLTRMRMDRAKQMLASERSVTEVCFEIGYESLGSFSSKFRARFGRSPVEFQREVRRVFGYNAPWRVLRLPGMPIARVDPNRIARIEKRLPTRVRYSLRGGEES